MILSRYIRSRTFVFIYLVLPSAVLIFIVKSSANSKDFESGSRSTTYKNNSVHAEKYEERDHFNLLDSSLKFAEKVKLKQQFEFFSQTVKNEDINSFTVVRIVRNLYICKIL